MMAFLHLARFVLKAPLIWEGLKLLAPFQIRT